MENVDTTLVAHKDAIIIIIIILIDTRTKGRKTVSNS